MITVDCENCEFDHICCSLFWITLTKEEVKSGFFKYKRLRKVFQNGNCIGVKWTLTCQEDGYCMYFDKNTNLCKIHENKPLACQNWNNCSNTNKEIKKEWLDKYQALKMAK